MNIVFVDDKARWKALPKYKSTSEIMKIVGNKDQIRNFGVIAHVDHGN